MEIIYDESNLSRYMKNAIKNKESLPILLDRFLNDAIEVDVDIICDGKDVFIGGIMEHIEEAGIHSGDSACSLPPFSLSQMLQSELKRQVKSMAFELGVIGLMNTQFAIKGEDIYVLEVNPRASRTVPFVSKATGKALAKIAAKVMAGQSLREQNIMEIDNFNFFSVKESVFPFVKFPKTDSLLGPEMKSTGEVMGTGDSFAEAYLHALLAAGEVLPQKGETVFISLKDNDKKHLVKLSKQIINLGYKIVATRGTYKVLQEENIEANIVKKLAEGRPNIVDSIKGGEISLVINTTRGQKTISDSFNIRRESIMNKTMYATTIAAANAIVMALAIKDTKRIKKLQDLH